MITLIDHGLTNSYACLDNDVSNLPTGENIPNGSDALILDTAEVYFYDSENEEWIKA